MNEQQAEVIMHYLEVLSKYAMAIDDKLERLLDVAEANKPEKPDSSKRSIQQFMQEHRLSMDDMERDV